MHFKYSLLTASLAAALTVSGCGGGEGGSEQPKKPSIPVGVPPVTTPVVGGVVITTIDGYLKNALICSDLNDDGDCQVNEIITDINGNLVLTNEKGLLDIKVTKEVENSFNSHPVVVKILEPYADYSNFGVKPGIYTVDMDQPYQAMGKSVVFRAPAGAKIASPITDLVVAEMKKGNDLAEAEASVQDMLSDLKDADSKAEIDLYADYVNTKASGTEAEKQLASKLHKTAQILTETQHQAADDDIELDAVINDVVDQAVIEVVKMADAGDDNLYNPDYKPVVTVKKDNGKIDVGDVVANYAAVVDKAKLDLLSDELDQQDFNTKESFDFTTEATVKGIFTDGDLGEGIYPAVTLTAISVEHLKAQGIDVDLDENQKLVVRSINEGGSSTAKVGKYYIELVANDKNAKKDIIGPVITRIQFTVGTVPEVNTTKLNELQESINQLDLLDGRPVDTSVNIENLFTDKDGDKLTYTVTGGNSGLLYDIQYPVLKITGTPQGTGSDPVTVVATDDDKNKDEAVLDFSVGKFIFATDGSPIVIFNPVTYYVKTPDSRTVIGTYKPQSGELLSPEGQLVYQYNQNTGVISDASGKEVGTLNKDGTVSLPSVPGENRGIVVTSIDGYLKNALVCTDLNNDGDCQVNEIITDINGNLVLTNEQGLLDIEVTKETEDKYRNYPVITKTLEPYTDYSNLGVAPGIYTVDIDQPYQAMGKSVVFRAPAGAKIASPITDIVVAEMNKGNDQAAAEANVRAMLGVLKGAGSNAEIDLYADYINTKASGTEAEKQLASKLHKTAQILTETQHQAADNIDLDAVINDVVKQVVTEVNLISNEDLYNPDFKPVVPIKKGSDGSVKVEAPVANYAAVVDGFKLGALAQEIDQLEINNSEVFSYTTNTTVEGVFGDSDLVGSYPAVGRTAASTQYLTAHGLAATIDSRHQLTIRSINDAEGNSTAKAGEYFIELVSNDKNANGDVVGQVKTLVRFEVGVFQSAPVVKEDKKLALQGAIKDLGLQEGQPVNASVSIEGLFTDKDGDALTYKVIEGNTGLQYELVNSQLNITGTPNLSGSFTLSVVASDDDNNQAEVKVQFTIDEKLATSNPLSDVLVGKNLYRFESGWAKQENDKYALKPKCWAARFTDDNKVLRANSAYGTCLAEGEIQTQIGSWQVDGNNIKVVFDNGEPLKLVLRDDASGDANLPRVHLYEIYQQADISKADSDYKLDSETQSEPTTFFVGRESAEAYWQQSTAEININGELTSVEAESKIRAAVEGEDDLLDVDVFLETSCENLGFVKDGGSSTGYTFGENMAYEFYLLNDKFENGMYSLHGQSAQGSVAFAVDNNTACGIDFDYPGSGSPLAEFEPGESVVVAAEPTNDSASEEFIINTSVVSHNDTFVPEASLAIDEDGIYVPFPDELYIERWYRGTDGKIRAELIEYAPLTDKWKTTPRNDVELTEYDVDGKKLVQVLKLDPEHGGTKYYAFTAWTDDNQKIKSLKAGSDDTPEVFSYVMTFPAAKISLINSIDSADKVITAADGNTFAVYNPVTHVVKAADGITVIGIYDPTSGNITTVDGQVVYQHNLVTGVITDASGKEVGTVNEDGTIAPPSEPDEGDKSVPVVNTDQLALLQASIDGLELQEGQSINASVNFAELFTDEDGDKLTYTLIDGKTGLSYEVLNSTLNITGTPQTSGKFSLKIVASDDDSNQVEASVQLNIKEKPATSNPLTELLVGKGLYRFDIKGIRQVNGQLKPNCWITRFTEDNKLFVADSADGTCPIEDGTQLEISSWQVDGDKLGIGEDGTPLLSLIHDASGDAKLPRVHMYESYSNAVIETLESEYQSKPFTFFIGKQSAEAYWQQSTAEVIINGELTSVEAESKSRAAVTHENDILDVDVFFDTSCESLGFVADNHSSLDKPSYTFGDNMAYEFYLLNDKFENGMYSLRQQSTQNSVAFGNDSNTECGIDFDYPGMSSSVADIKPGESVVFYAEPADNSVSEEFIINTSVISHNDTIVPKASLAIDTTGIYISIQEELAVERWYRDANGQIQAELIEYSPLTEKWNTAPRNDIELTEYDVNGKSLVQYWEWEYTQSGETKYFASTVWTDDGQTIKALNAGDGETVWSYPYTTSLIAAQTELTGGLNSKDKIITDADGTSVAVYNPVTFIVKSPDGNTVIGKYDPLSGEVFDAAGKLVYQYNLATRVITDAGGKEVGSLNEDGTITLPSDPDGGDGNNGGDNGGSEGDTGIMTPDQFISHGDVTETETITVQSTSGPTVVTINSDVTVFGNLTIKDSK